MNGISQSGMVWTLVMNTAASCQRATLRASGCLEEQNRVATVTVSRSYSTEVNYHNVWSNWWSRLLWIFMSLSYFRQTFTDNICLTVLFCPGSGSDWKTVVVNGKAPSPRTYHTNTACLGNRLYVFCGGEAGAAPVSDLKLHVFDSGLCWFCYCVNSKCISKAFIAIGFLKSILTVSELLHSLFVVVLNNKAYIFIAFCFL